MGGDVPAPVRGTVRCLCSYSFAADVVADAPATVTVCRQDGLCNSSLFPSLPFPLPPSDVSSAFTVFVDDADAGTQLQVRVQENRSGCDDQPLRPLQCGGLHTVREWLSDPIQILPVFPAFVR